MFVVLCGRRVSPVLSVAAGQLAQTHLSLNTSGVAYLGASRRVCRVQSLGYFFVLLGISLQLFLEIRDVLDPDLDNSGNY